MTSAKLTGLPKEHGLTPALNDLHHAAFDRGEQIGDIVALVRLRATKVTKSRINNGLARGVEYEILRIEPVKDEEGQRLNLVLEDGYIARTSKGARVLPFDFGGRPDAQRQAELNAEIREWADVQGLTPRQLGDLWNEYFAVGESQVDPFGPHSAVLHLLDFAHKYDIVKDEIQGDDPAEPDDDDDEPDDADTGAGADVPEDEPAEATS